MSLYTQMVDLTLERLTPSPHSPSLGIDLCQCEKWIVALILAHFEMGESVKGKQPRKWEHSHQWLTAAVRNSGSPHGPLFWRVSVSANVEFNYAAYNSAVHLSFDRVIIFDVHLFLNWCPPCKNLGRKTRKRSALNQPAFLSHLDCNDF